MFDDQAEYGGRTSDFLAPHDDLEEQMTAEGQITAHEDRIKHIPVQFDPAPEYPLVRDVLKDGFHLCCPPF